MKRNFILIAILFGLSSVLYAQANSSKIIFSVKSPGMYGDNIKLIQEKLIKIGFTEIGEIDGYYGPKTESAVKQLQKIIGCEENGILNQELFDLINNESFNEIVQIDKIDSVETFEKVLDCSGYIFEVYYDNYEIKKITKKYWIAYSPDYIREEQFSESIYFFNNKYVKKWIQDSEVKMTYNLRKEEAESLVELVIKLK